MAVSATSNSAPQASRAGEPHGASRRALSYPVAVTAISHLVRAVGLCAALVIATSVWIYVGPPAYTHIDVAGFPDGLSNEIVAMEFVRSQADIAAVVGDRGHTNRDAMRATIHRDYAFIASYSLLYLLVAMLLATRSGLVPKFAALVAITTGLLSAWFDVVEDRGILAALDLPIAQTSIELARGIREACLIKWALAFVALAVLSLAFVGVGRIANTVAAAFLVAAGIGFVSLVYIPAVQLFGLPLLVGLALLAAVGIARPTLLVAAP